ncbi:MAG: sterol desaturase family protein [Acidimicrobiales bacterium]|nr:sterol desaturase family protein [Acidimicrobiales bacterium]
MAAVLYGGTAVAALAAPVIKRRLARRLPEPVAELATMGGLIGVGWTTIIAAERLRPFKQQWNRSHGDVTTDALDVASSAVAARVGGALLSLPVRNVIAGARRGRGGGPLARLPLPVRVIVTIHAVDLYHSLVHRLAHEWGPLWRVHAVHHSAPRLYWLNATRFHPIELALEGTAEAILLALLGADADTVLALNVVRGIYGQIQHGNVDVDSGPLNAVLATPERHRWHHSTVVAEGNTNYGAVVATWDRLMGTAWLPAERPFDAEIGVGGDPDYPQAWTAQLAAPFVRR